MRTIVLVSFIALSGCSGWVDADQYERAKDVCSAHGGVAYVEGSIIDSSTFAAWCKDSSKITALTRPRS